jgi:glucose-6-phosphate-specific signal transduction histidine kinase
MSEADHERRLRNLERMLDNGRFVRVDVFREVRDGIGDDLARIQSELGMIRKAQEDERKAREDDRKGIRNLVLGAIAAGGVSLVVSLIMLAVTRGP